MLFMGAVPDTSHAKPPAPVWDLNVLTTTPTRPWLLSGSPRLSVAAEASGAGSSAMALSAGSKNDAAVIAAVAEVAGMRITRSGASPTGSMFSASGEGWALMGAESSDGVLARDLLQRARRANTRATQGPSSPAWTSVIGASQSWALERKTMILQLLEALEAGDADEGMTEMTEDGGRDGTTSLRADPRTAWLLAQSYSELALRGSFRLGLLKLRGSTSTPPSPDATTGLVDRERMRLFREQLILPPSVTPAWVGVVDQALFWHAVAIIMTQQDAKLCQDRSANSMSRMMLEHASFAALRELVAEEDAPWMRARLELILPQVQEWLGDSDLQGRPPQDWVCRQFRSPLWPPVVIGERLEAWRQETVSKFMQVFQGQQ